MKLAAVFMLVAFASPATAQSVAGIRFGDTLESVRPRYSGDYALIDGLAGASYITRADGHIWFCNERVTSMQERVSRDLHVFTDQVVELTAQHGDPDWLAMNVQTVGGEISTLEARWRLPDYTLSIGYLYNAGQLDVTRTYSIQDTCTGTL